MSKARFLLLDERTLRFGRPALAFAAMLAVDCVSIAYLMGHRPTTNVAKSTGSQPNSTSIAPPAASQAKSPGPETLALLLPATSRSAGPALSITLAPKIGIVDVQWLVPGEATSDTGFTLRVWSGPRPVASVGAASYEHVSGQVVAHFPVAADKLSAGDYQLQVTSSPSNHAATERESTIHIEREP